MRSPEGPGGDDSSSGPNDSEHKDEKVGERRGSALGLTVNYYLRTGIGFITGPITARALGPAGQGVVAAVQVYDTGTTLLFSMGLNQAAGYFAVTKTYARRALMGTILRLSVMALPVVAVTAFVIVHGPLSHFGPSIRFAAAALVVLSPLSLMGLTARSFLAADGDLETIRRQDLIPIGVNALVVVPLGIIGALSVLAAVIAILAGEVLANVYALVRAGVFPSGAAPAGALLSYGARSWFATLANFGNLRLDQALVAPLLGVQALGQYSIAATVSALPLGIASALATRAYGDVGQLRGADAAKRVEEAVRVAFVATTALGVALAAVVPIAIPLVYGGQFRPAVAPTLILIPGTVFLALVQTANQCAFAMGVPEYATYGAATGLLVTVIGLPLAIPFLGINGAALVSVVSYATISVVQLVLLRRRGVRRVVPGRRDVLHLWKSLRA